MPDAPGLDRLERWVHAVVTHPDGAEGGLASDDARAQFAIDAESLEELILPSKRVSALERISIYARMYYWRLIDVLADDFQTVHHVLGGDEWMRVAREYIALHPSTNPNLLHLPAHFPEFLRTEAVELPHRAFLVDVARIELACAHVFSDRHVAPVTSEALGEIPPDGWGDARFEPIAAVRVLELDHPASDFITARREDRHMDIPEPQPSWVLIYRRDYSVWRKSLDREQFTVLTSLLAGHTLTEALEACADLPGADLETIAGDVGTWFQSWTGNGVFARIHVAD